MDRLKLKIRLYWLLGFVFAWICLWGMGLVFGYIYERYGILGVGFITLVFSILKYVDRKKERKKKKLAEQGINDSK